MKSFLLSLLFITACGLTHDQTAKITADASKYALCLELCVHTAGPTEEDFEACAQKCDKLVGLEHKPVIEGVVKAVSGE